MEQNIVSWAVQAPIEGYGSAFVSTSKAHVWLGPSVCKNWLASQEEVFHKPGSIFLICQSDVLDMQKTLSVHNTPQSLDSA